MCVERSEGPSCCRGEEEDRKAIELPSWFSTWTAAPLGVLVTGANLPNAFPYFIAIERLIVADVAIPTGLLLLGAYALVYCTPCLILFALGMTHGDKVNLRLRKILDRFSTGTIKRSLPIALVARASIRFTPLAPSLLADCFGRLGSSSPKNTPGTNS